MFNADLVVLVDEKDKAVGVADKLFAHQLGLLHRAFSVFVFRNNEGERELLLQRRQLDKYHSGGLWTNTCCSHPAPQESILDAAKRRLQQELGLVLKNPLSLKNSFCYRAGFENGLVEHELDHVVVGEYQGENIQSNEIEVAEFAWVKISELTKDLIANPKKYTPWFSNALHYATMC